MKISPAVLLCLVGSALLPSLTGAAEGTEQSRWCGQLGKRLKSVDTAFCNALPFVPGDTRTHEDRPLFVLEQAAGAKAGTKTETGKGAGVKAGKDTRRSTGKNANTRATRIFMIGGIHGDELTSVSIVFRWLGWLGEAEARKHHWRIVPLVNPDGLFMRPSRRTNGRGVDLNRNFPTPDWSRDAILYWQKRTGNDPRRYPGSTPMSEPETRWLTEEIRKFRPDIIISIHAPYGILDYDGARQKPSRFGHLNLNQLGVYPGSLGNFGGVHQNIPVVTIELSHASVMPPLAEQRQIWTDMLAWISSHAKAKP